MKLNHKFHQLPNLYSTINYLPNYQLTHYSLPDTTIMACDMMTRSGTPCSRAAIYAVESLIDGQLTRICCCTQHRPKAIQKITYDDPSHIGHDENTRSSDINMHLIVERITTSDVEHVHVGSVAFGPVTKLDHLEREYDECFYEYTMMLLSDKMDKKKDPGYPEWHSKFEMCKARLDEIYSRIEPLERCL